MSSALALDAVVEKDAARAAPERLKKGRGPLFPVRLGLLNVSPKLNEDAAKARGFSIRC